MEKNYNFKIINTSYKYKNKNLLNNIIPLQFNNNSDSNNIENILLIHDEVQDFNKFVLSCNNNSFPIVYNIYSSKEELLKLLKNKFINIKRFALVFHNSNIDTNKQFLDNLPLFSNDDLINSPNVQFIIELVKEFNIQYLDYLACNTLNFDHWNKYYQFVKENTNVIIGAYNDKLLFIFVILCY
jgi:hypothetical protein